ncbi:hypothetical protein Tco_0801215 [Tanacetum coccineum]|uniref:Uncharacterized protein n=1 Tax=Tanacetum coccineum TaxID=301880 RepID=A0ABQ4ZW76_9ASTR
MGQTNRRMVFQDRDPTQNRFCLCKIEIVKSHRDQPYSHITKYPDPRVEGDDEDEDEDDEDGSDSGSDGAESSSPDASMADIIPMLDELHPLLSEEQESREVPHLSPRDGSVAGSEHSLESSDSSSESNDDDDDDDEGAVENCEGLEVGNDDEDKESKHIDKLDEI